MSEIKGQLLGIIIVLMVFAAVGGAMVTLFTNFSNSIEGTVSEVVNAELASDTSTTGTQQTVEDQNSIAANANP